MPINGKEHEMSIVYTKDSNGKAVLMPIAWHMATLLS